MTEPAPSPRLTGLLRAAGSLALGAVALLWLWLQQAGTGAMLVALCALGGAALLSVDRRVERRALAVGVQALVLVAALVGLHGAVPIGGGELSRLGSTATARASLCGSVFLGLYGLYLVARSALGSRVAFLRLWLRAAAGARPVVAALGIFVLALVAAEFFYLGDGQRFDYRAARNHPLFAFHMPGTYQYAHARERVVADMHHHPFTQHKPPDVFRIVLNGASTVAGFGLQDADRPAEVLRELLADGVDGKRVEVILLGVSGKYQVNELIDTVVTLPHWAPDLVLSMNGYNEINYGENEGHYEGMPYSELEIQQALNVAPELGALYAYSHLGAGLWKRRWGAPWPGRPLLREAHDYEPPRYFGYLRRTARSLADLGVPYVYTFCPNVFAWRNRQDPAQLSPEVLGRFREMAMLAQSRSLAADDAARRPEAERIVTEEGQIYFPVMDLLEPFAEVGEVFRDDCHFSPKGVRLVMAEVVRKLPRWTAEWQPPGRQP
jgi:lysophospholipase L1-like esterase